MTEKPSLPTWIPTFMRLHAVLLLVFAGGLYMVPSKVFGQAALEPSSRFAHSLLAATLVGLAIAILGASNAKNREFLQVGLIGALVLDVHVPFLITMYPESMRVFGSEYGSAAFLVPLTAIIGLVIPTGFALLETRRLAELS